MTCAGAGWPAPSGRHLFDLDRCGCCVAIRGWRGRVACPAELTRWGSRPHFVQRARRPAPATHAFEPSGLKADPAFGRSDSSGCSDAVHGSPFLACEILDCHTAVAGELAGQVATKRVSGSRFSPSVSGLLRSGNQGGCGPSWWWGDWEAGGRTSAAGGRFLARLSLDAFFQAPKDSSQKMSAPTVLSPTAA